MEKVRLILFLFLTVFFVVSSCKNDNTGKKKILIDPNRQSEFDNLVSAMDASRASDSTYSLRFENDEFQRKQILFFLYDNISCTKWVYEEDKKDGGRKIVTFYFNKGKLFHSNEVTFSETSVYQTNSYYNEKQQGIYSSERTAENFMELEKAALKPRDFISHNFKECMDIKDAKGDFATKFVELLNFEGIDFIRVGNKESGGYWTDLVVPELTDSIKNLGNSKSNVGKPLKIAFSVKNLNGLDFQVLEKITY